MAYSGYCLYEPQFPPPPGLLFRETNEISCSYNGSDEYFPSDVPPLYPVSGLGNFFAPEITMYGSSIASFFGGSSWDWQDECYDGEELPYKDYGNCVQGDDAHFSTCWEYYFPEFDNDPSAEQVPGDFHRSEDQIDDTNMAGETTPASHSYDDAASRYEYWLEQLWEEHSAQDQWEELQPCSNDYGFCSDIFGYWPCMLQRNPGSL